ncbi:MULTISPECIES: glycosyl hydrolase 2 galactose-binding domain-containing protein [Paenibacillus]|uniref:beta-mannosidase n=1 Tax=Paenibacillus TaxID=44249 RepID=UPI001C8DC911|nr:MULTISPECIES: glycoside hydrolase family 2 protein [Paenibacillus]MBY0218827.1 glycoside hydrolase family 2 protein [Paenibacillus illinoisensis]WJH29901.1 glycoside hydrolase family 2 protein [Paenibacillus sp. CC-CFT742]
MSKIQSQIFQNWTFKACEDQEWLPAQVPGCVHTDLLKLDKIPDPFYGTNEKEIQWIDKKDWEYRTVFDINEDLLSQEHLEIVFDGLDTYADVYVNDQHVLSADNMFRVWNVDVKSIVKASGNVLRIRFRSPIQEDLPKLEKLGYALPASNDQSDVGGLGDKRVSIFARKAPYHYGWDWGPRFVTSGIWREARLEGWSEVRINDVFIRQNEVTASAASLTAIVEVETFNPIETIIRIVTDGQTWEQAASLQAGVQTIEIPVSINEPKLWWSRGLGDPHMYSFVTEVLKGEQVLADLTVKTGLRSIRLVRDKDEAGASFYFELNGVAVFAKGANHIPNDSFITEITAERYRHEIVSAAESNMNMLRVWGGGIYEEDVFYELCDEYGLLVWQDFMFACSMYPGDEAFLNSVRHEAIDNVKRLRNHPSIVLWCGNNEIDSAWAHYIEDGGWGWKKDYNAEQREKIWADYEAIFHELLPEVVEAYAPGVDYWPSSPLVSLTNDEKQHANPSTSEGDIHYWGVWHSVEPFENYNVYVGRFMSEYGFQSFPEYKSVRKYAEEEDLALESEVMLAHQKNGAGNRLIKQYMDMYMHEPKDFPSFLYMSQVLQAEAMKTAIEAHRRRKPYCMGTLYWQMNDCWPVASWAGMDYFGNWKALQYYAKRSFSDVLVSVDGTKEDRTDVYLISDQLHPVEGQLHVRLIGFDGTVYREEEHAVSLESNSGKQVLTLNNTDWLQGRDAAATLLRLELKRKGHADIVQEHYFAPSKDLALKQAAIQVTEVQESDGSYVVLESDTLAKQVWISTEAEGVFSDNFFDLIPSIPVKVKFTSREGLQHAGAASETGAIEVRSMADFIKL